MALPAFATVANLKPHKTLPKRPVDDRSTVRAGCHAKRETLDLVREVESKVEEFDPYRGEVDHTIHIPF